MEPHELATSGPANELTPRAYVETRVMPPQL